MDNSKQLKNNMAEIQDISFIIQGEVNYKVTFQAIKNIRQFFPDSEIVLSTYLGSNTKGLAYDKLALVEDPGFYYYHDQPGANKHNVNRQIQTTLAGLKMATRKYAFKLRSDFIITGSNFLEYFNQFSKYDENYKVFEQKILSAVFFARDPRRKNCITYAFHPSDIAFFGLRTDLINLFDIPFMTYEESFSYELNGIHYARYVPEQYIWINCLLKNGKDVNCRHQRDNNEKIAEETEKFAVSNFIYLDWKQFSLLPPKHLVIFSDICFQNVITHVEWLKLYKDYLDSSLILPDRDLLREVLRKNSYIFSFCKFIANLCAIFFVGKKTRNFRKKTRKKVLKYLTKDLTLLK